MQLANLPPVANARLPAIYEKAKQQLAECARIDECKDWADKAAALASYAKQSDDKKLEKLAIQIRARAIRRCGELLKELDRPKQGGRPKQNYTDTGIVSQSRAAKDAGMSKRQKDTALRVASVPKAEFEAAVESNDPPTAATLAKRGTKQKPLVDLGGRDPADFKKATTARSAIGSMLRASEEVLPSAVVRGLLDQEYKPILKKARDCHKWLSRLIEQLERKVK